MKVDEAWRNRKMLPCKTEWCTKIRLDNAESSFMSVMTNADTLRDAIESGNPAERTYRTEFDPFIAAHSEGLHMAAFNWQSLLGKFVRNRELPQDPASNAPVEPIRNFGVSETTAAVGLIIPAVASEEQDRRRIEQVDALWSAKLPTEVEQQWSRYPTSHPIVAAEINRRSSDDAGKDAYAHLGHYLSSVGEQLPMARVASICCGAGALERGLMSIGLISACTGYDLASGALETAREAAAAAGYASLRYEFRDLEKNGLDTGDLDIVFAHQGVHHIERLEETFDAVRASLRIGGYFHLHEFVGPDRFQWQDRQVDEMTSWMQSLPERYRRTADGALRNDVGRATIAEMIESDPSEAVRSSAIEPLLAERFEIVERRALGMTLVMSALAGIAHNFAVEDAEAVDHIQRLLDRERDLIADGELVSDFVTILARRTS